MGKASIGSAAGDCAEDHLALRSLAVVARQPLFDAARQLKAYELLYRTPGSSTARITNQALATAEVVISATLDIGFNRLVGPHPAFINFPAELLISGFRPPLRPERVVIEVLEGARPDPGLLQSLDLLRAQGYRIALDDFDIRTGSMPLLAHTDIVKVDIREHTPDALAESVRALRRHPVQLVAEKIETVEEWEHCLALGFDLFQGYLLQRPQNVEARRAPTARAAVLQLVVRLNDPGLSLDDIEQAIRRDVGMSYRLLRCINSSYFGMRREVGSIREAVTLLGVGEVQKLCWLMLLSGLDDQPAYLCVHALQRARMCEALCLAAGLPGSEAYFMTGMLSMLDELLGESLPEAIGTLPVGNQIMEALLQRRGDMGLALCCVERYERGDWDSLQFHNLPPERILDTYLQATEWADATFHSWIT